LRLHLYLFTVHQSLYFKYTHTPTYKMPSNVVLITGAGGWLGGIVSPPFPPTLRNLMSSSPLSSFPTLEHQMSTSSWPILSSLKHQRELNMSLPEKPIYAIPKRLTLSSTLNLELQTPSTVSTVSCPEDPRTTLISV
jgi:hypothetical protein